MKYCPKCGAKLSSNDKYCDRCGAYVGAIKPSINSHRTSKPTNVNTPSKMNKNSRIRRNCLIIAACVMILAAGGTVFFALQSENHANAIPFIGGKNKTTDFDDTAKSLGFTDKKMSPKDMAGLTISFAHMHFPNDSDWEQAFEDAENGNLNIRSYPEYQFGDYEVKAPTGGAVYVVSPKVGYVVSDVDHPEQAKVTFVSDKGQNKAVDLPNLTQQVKAKSSKDDVQKVVRKVYIAEKSTVKDAGSSSASSSSSSSSSTSNSDEKISWDDDKEEQLADFMDSFGKKMKQDYDEYDGHDSIKTLAGEHYPEDFDNFDFKLYSDDSSDKQTIDIGWDPSLKKDYDYHVVSIFNCNVGSPETHITYLFCVHDDKPVALVDQTTNGNYIAVKETDNKDVRTAFANILEGNNDDDDD